MCMVLSRENIKVNVKKWLSFKKELTASADETSFTYVCQHLHSNRILPKLKNRHLCRILEIGLQQ